MLKLALLSLVLISNAHAASRPVIRCSGTKDEAFVILEVNADGSARSKDNFVFGTLKCQFGNATTTCAGDWKSPALAAEKAYAVVRQDDPLIDELSAILNRPQYYGGKIVHLGCKRL